MANQLRYNTFDNARIKSNNYYACVIDFKLYGSLVKKKTCNGLQCGMVYIYM